MITSEGDESAKAIAISLTAPPPQRADYKAIGTGIANWKSETRTHLFFLIRFLNPSLPPDVRWLNGYRLIEWHFMKGKDGLAGNKEWRSLLEKHRDNLNDHLRPNQTLHGLIEETRALAAHAVLDNRTDADRIKNAWRPHHMDVFNLEALVSEIMNDPELNYGRIKLLAHS